jgi:hypothetical protein
MNGDELNYLVGRESVPAFSETLTQPYRKAIVEAILEDPVAADHRFADFNTRCCCGKRLTDDLSKVYGIGPSVAPPA